ncbi:TonB-dependent receptor [Sphingomonas sp. CGMCC 1.13654]|uniref:TonB-dependent receptor n=1 Tax=Sphingomonas chungangi TaxID=2683589 RepID=A0A838L794_9SPHN|nr:TonB-dependent receptor [Sphingomonas chungangi]MBA2934800.1 TonB-dependent receptor [Sphingomonas chungangi]
MVERVSIPILAAMLASAAHAQKAPAAPGDTPSADAPAAPPDANIGDIVVTARKQNETLETVPLTVTAFSSKSIEKLQIKSLYDLAANTPGLSFGTTGGRNGINKLQIRNLSTGTSGISKASVFVDGVYFPGDYSSAPIANLDRVEVLKGPQSVAYGRSTFAGAVNFITRDPPKRLSGRIDAQFATLGQQDISGYVGGPIADGVSDIASARYYNFRGPGDWTNRDGYHFGNQRTISLTNKLVLEPVDDLRIKLYTSYNHDRDHAAPTLIYLPSQRNLTILRPDGTYSYYYTGETSTSFTRPFFNEAINGYLDDPGVKRDQYRIHLSADYVVAGQTVTAFVAHGHETLHNNYDIYSSGFGSIVRPDSHDVPQTHAYGALFFRTVSKTTDTQAELRVSAPSDWRLRYTVGYNYTDLTGHTNNYFPGITAAGVPFAAPTPAQSTDNWNNVNNPARDNSGFGGLYFDLTDKITISGEVRYQSERIETTDYLAGTHLSKTFNAWLPRANIQYRISPHFQVYAVYAVGNNPGGFNTSAPAARIIAAGLPVAYGEERLNNYEAGIKSTWLGGKLLVNLAGYHMDWKHQQVPQGYILDFPTLGAPSTITTSTASSRVSGFEGEVQAIPFAGLNLRGTVSYGDARYVHYCSSNYATLLGFANGPGCSYVDGKRQEGTPAWQFSLSGDYTHRLNDRWSYYLRADYEYAGRVYNEEFDYSWTGPTNLVNAYIGLESDHYSIQLFVKNLTQERTALKTFRFVDTRAAGGVYPAIQSTIGPIPAGAAGYENLSAYPRTPRQFGVTLGYKF